MADQVVILFMSTSGSNQLKLTQRCPDSDSSEDGFQMLTTTTTTTTTTTSNAMSDENAEGGESSVITKGESKTRSKNDGGSNGGSNNEDGSGPNGPRTTLGTNWHEGFARYSNTTPNGSTQTFYVLKETFDPYEMLASGKKTASVKFSGTKKMYQYLKKEYETVPLYNLPNKEKRDATYNNCLPRLIFDEAKLIEEDEFYRHAGAQEISKFYKDFSAVNAKKFGGSAEAQVWVPTTEFRDFEGVQLGEHGERWEIMVPFTNIGTKNFNSGQSIILRHELYGTANFAAVVAFYRGLRIYNHVVSPYHRQDYGFDWAQSRQQARSREAWKLICDLSTNSSSSLSSSSSSQKSAVALDAEWTATQLDRSYTESFEGSARVTFCQSAGDGGMSTSECIACHEEIMIRQRPEIMARLKKLVAAGIELFDLYPIDPRLLVPAEGKYYRRTSLSIAELKAMLLGHTTHPV